MRAGFILFTEKGERVPFFTERTPAADGNGEVQVAKHGWKDARAWRPGFFVVRRRDHYRVGAIRIEQRALLGGAIYQLRAWDLQPAPGFYLDQRFPNVPSVEMFLRHVYGTE